MGKIISNFATKNCNPKNTPNPATFYVLTSLNNFSRDIQASL